MPGYSSDVSESSFALPPTKSRTFAASAFPSGLPVAATDGVVAVTTSSTTPPTTYRARLFGVVLVAAWMGAFAATSTPATHAQAMPNPTDCTFHPAPFSSGAGEWWC